MSPSLTISLTYSIIGIAPAIVLLALFKSTRPRYHGLWIFGLSLIVLGAMTIGLGTELLTDTEEWLGRQKEAKLIALGKEATIQLKIWAFVFPGATVALGVNLLTEFLLRRNGEGR